MKNKIIIGTYYKDKDKAEKKAKEKSWKENKYEVLEFRNGYMVVSKRQKSAIGQ